MDIQMVIKNMLSQPSAALRNTKKIRVADHQEKNPEPPFDFRHEISSSEKCLEDLPRPPGKNKKGKTYDLSTTIQRRVSFAEDEIANGSKLLRQESETEDPLYSTIKPKRPVIAISAEIKHKAIKESVADDEDEISFNLKKDLSTIRVKKHNTHMKGIENQAFTLDEKQEENYDIFNQTSTSPLKSQPQVIFNECDTTVKDSFDNNLQGNGDRNDTSQSNFSNRINSSKFLKSEGKNLILWKKRSLPLILTSDQSSVESAGLKQISEVNRVIGDMFAFITFPFTLFIIFLHHLIRFILLGLLKPLLLDTLTLVVEFLLSPLISGVVHPLLLTTHGAATAASNILVIIIRPVTTILQSIRLVEVNYGRNCSVEDV